MVSVEASGTRDTLTSTDPVTGEPVGRFPVHEAADVSATVTRARAAARWWADLGWDERARRLHRLKGILARRADELCDLVHRESGKTSTDALIEVVLATEHLDWAARKARGVLQRRRVSPGLLMVNQRAQVTYEPMGVVGVIAPWNYPVFTPMGAITGALAAGNAVVLKPSEHTPAVGRWLAEAVAEVVPEEPLLQAVTGFGETGEALCTSGVDKLAFTGSSPTARKVMAACAGTLTPLVIESGGSDAMIVDDDADLDAAATAAVWGGLHNAGQTCIAVERVYVAEAVADRFTERVVELAGEVRAGPDDDAAVGAMTRPAQIDRITEHLDDALARGARLLLGGREAIRPPFVDPIVLTDVPDDALLMQQESFGPLLPITPVRDREEALERANAAPNLAATVFARARGDEIARRLRAGMVSVNAVHTYAAIPALPFGGLGESGFGRVHGEEGLREFARTKAVTRERFGLPVDLTSFRRPPAVTELVRRVMRLRHGRR